MSDVREWVTPSASTKPMDIAARLAVPQGGAECSAGFGGVTAVFGGFFDGQGELFVDSRLTVRCEGH